MLRLAGPPAGGSILQHQFLPLVGSGKDAEDGELSGASLEWFVDTVAAGTGNSIDKLKPAANGWSLGDHVVTLRVTDSGFAVTETERTFTVVGDEDNDGVPTPVDKSSCGNTGVSLDADPTNQFGAADDLDGDGIKNAEDADPCAAATFYVVAGDFDPDMLYIPSAGKTVTMLLRGFHRNSAQIPAASVGIIAINNKLVSCTNDFRNVGWTPAGVNATAKFDRQKLITYLRSQNVMNERVAITIGTRACFGSSPWTFSSTDAFNVAPGS
jgi:hypothetical protein